MKEAKPWRLFLYIYGLLKPDIGAIRLRKCPESHQKFANLNLSQMTNQRRITDAPGDISFQFKDTAEIF